MRPSVAFVPDGPNNNGCPDRQLGVTSAHAPPVTCAPLRWRRCARTILKTYRAALLYYIASYVPGSHYMLHKASRRAYIHAC